MANEFILAGTGSRELQRASAEEKKIVMDKLRTIVSFEKSQHGDELIVMSGMAEGFDKALAVTALSLNVKLWCAIPNKGYGEYYWGKNSYTGENRLAEFNSIVERAAYVTYIMEDVHKARGLTLKGRHSNFVRNDWMVENADRFVIWDPQSPGTRDCFKSVKKAGLPYEVLTF